MIDRWLDALAPGEGSIWANIVGCGVIAAGMLIVMFW